MNPAETNTEAGRQLDLPMVTFFSVRTTSGRSVAHALDFDLVATAATSKEALHKLRMTVERHIEFGFKRGLPQDAILQSAPQECWDKIKNAQLSLGEEIAVNDHRIRTLTRTSTDELDASLIEV